MNASTRGGVSTSGKRGTMPSSAHSTSISRPLRSRTAAAMAMAHGPWTRLPNGLSTHTRQSPITPIAAGNLLAYLRDQAEAAGAVPDDRTIVVERYRDEQGYAQIATVALLRGPVFLGEGRV